MLALFFRMCTAEYQPQEVNENQEICGNLDLLHFTNIAKAGGHLVLDCTRQLVVLIGQFVQQPDEQEVCCRAVCQVDKDGGYEFPGRHRVMPGMEPESHRGKEGKKNPGDI